MKVVFLSVSGQLGGAERLLLDLLGAIREARADWPLSLVAGEEGPLLPRAMELGCAAAVLPLPERLASVGDSSGSRLGGLVTALPGVLRYRRELRELLAREEADIVHSNNFKMHVLSAMARPRGPRLVWHMHDYVRPRRMMRRLVARYSPAVSSFIAISQSIAADVRAVVRHPGRVRVALNAVDLVRFSPSGPVADLDALAGMPREEQALRVGLPAAFARWKGHEVFLEAIAALPRDIPVRAYIVGGPLYRTAGSQLTLEELRARARSLGILERTGFTGFLEDTAPALRALDIVVHASTEPEPFGLAAAEAMACGRALVASFAGGVQEFLRSGVNGLGHRPGDVAGLASCIERYARRPELRKQYGEAARRTAEQLFRRERLGREVIGVYEGLR